MKRSSLIFGRKIQKILKNSEKDLEILQPNFENTPQKIYDFACFPWCLINIFAFFDRLRSF